MAAGIYESPRDLLGAEGTAVGPSDWLLVDQLRIDSFAEATGDRQWIHVDRERAAAGPFGKTIAHGYLTMSLANYFLPQLIDVRGFTHGVNVGADRVRFPAPVPVDTRVRGRGEILSVVEIEGAIQSIVRITVEMEGGNRPACVIDTVSRYFQE